MRDASAGRAFRVGVRRVRWWLRQVRWRALRVRPAADAGMLDLRRPECRTVYAVLYRQSDTRR